MADQVKITELPESPTLPPGATAIVVDPTDPTDAPTGTTKRIAATLLVGPSGADGSDGAPGLSAYEVAVAQGFVGSETEWLASLKGPQGEPGADGADLALAGSGSATTAARSDHDHAGVYQPAGSYAPTVHSHAGLSTTIAAGSLWGGNDSGVPVAVPMGTGTAGSVPTRADADARYVTLATSQTISGLKTFSAQVVITHSADTYHYPYISLRRSLGTTASPLPVQGGTIVGGVNAYGYYNGEWNWSIGAAVFAVGPPGIAGPTGRYVVSVSTGAGTGTVTDVISGTAAGVTLHKPTTVQGDLAVTGTISGDGSPLAGVAKPADLAALARQVVYPWGGASPTVGVKAEARRRVARAATAIQIEAGCSGTRTGDCTLRVLKSTDGGATFGTTVGTITLSDTETHDYSTISVALAAGDYLCAEVVSVGGAATWWVALTCLSAGGA